MIYVGKIKEEKRPASKKSRNGGEKMKAKQQTLHQQLSIKQMTIAGLLGATSIVLGATPLGFIPVPTAAGHATIMHIPVIIGGILEGPMVGALTGLIFGLYSLFRASNPLFMDPIIALIPRLLIGVISYFVYKITKSDILAAALGTATNTIGVMSLAVLRGYLTRPAAWTVVITHGIPEILVAVAICVTITRTLRKVRR